MKKNYGDKSALFIAAGMIVVIVAVIVSFQLGRSSSNIVVPSNSTKTSTPYPNYETLRPTPTTVPFQTPLVYTSKRLGISFSYNADVSGKQKVIVKEIGSRVYIYTNFDEKPEDGKFVEVFSKVPKDSIQQALQKRYLDKPTGKNCKVTQAPVGGLDFSPHNDTYTTAGVWSTVDNTEERPFAAYEERAKCLQEPKADSGAVYFLTDSEHPSKLLLFVLGQDNFIAGTRGWDETIEFAD